MAQRSQNSHEIKLIAPQTLPRRFLLGAALAGASIGLASWAGWVGSLDAPESAAFRFSRGVSFAPGEEDRLRAFLDAVAAEERFGLRIVGHSGTEGDPEANRVLSENRAETARSLALAMQIPPERILFVGGLGGAAPLAQQDEETARELQRRLARVEVTVVVQ
ncbi:MAG: OmpA family protein [Pseudomonadota bacterium]